MSLNITTPLEIDIYNHKYITINAKQYDKNARCILVSCLYKGKTLFITNKHSVYIRYRKPDNFGVFNSCEITTDGKIVIELTEQMLAVAGISYVDLIIVENDNSGAVRFMETDSDNVISTMTFCINTYEAAYDNEDIESSYEYNALNDLLIKATADYEFVMASCNESEEEAEDAEREAKKSETNAKTSETNAKTSENAAKTSETNAKTSETKAATSEINAKTSETKAATSATNALNSETKAKTSETNAKASENVAKTSETNANTSEANALKSEQNAKASETKAKTSEDNARNYCEEVRTVAESLTGGFIPMGSITFSELATAQKVTGYVYNIRDDFTTDSTFREGAGLSYTAGTNVFWTANDEWDCLGGSASVTATVGEVKEFLGIDDGGEIS